MDSFELNKILGAFLGSLVFIFALGFISEAVYHPIENNGAAYELPEPELGAGAGPAVKEETPIAVLLASANAEVGGRNFKSCAGCHNAEPGAGKKVGPNLYGVVGRLVGEAEGFDYSQGFLDLKAEGATWDFDRLNAFIKNPKKTIRGTKMAAVTPSDKKRADIIAYLATLSDTPVALPTVEAAAEEVAEAVANVEAAAEDAVKDGEAMVEDAMKDGDAMVEDATKTDEAMVDDAMKAGDDAMKQGEAMVDDALQVVEEAVADAPAADAPATN